jgi:hypothetical protein
MLVYLQNDHGEKSLKIFKKGRKNFFTVKQVFAWNVLLAQRCFSSVSYSVTFTYHLCHMSPAIGGENEAEGRDQRRLHGLEGQGGVGGLFLPLPPPPPPPPPAISTSV